MHKKRIFILLLLLCVIFLQKTFADAYEERDGKGLLVMSNPSNVRVFINGIDRGYTPLSLPDISPGSYIIWLRRETYEDRRIAVTVPRQGRIVVSLSMEKSVGTLMVRPEKAPDVPYWLPFDPDVYVDGTPYSGYVLSLPVGYHSILVKAFGFEDGSASVFVMQDRIRVLELEMKLASYSMSDANNRRSRFNPANSGLLGMTECIFEVNAPGQGRFTVTDSWGTEVYSMDLKPFTSWSQHVYWDGRNHEGIIVPDGTYTIKIDTESIPWDNKPPTKQNLGFFVEVDSSIQIFPETMASAKSGLFFAPGTEILPQGSFQFDTLMLFGKPPTAANAWSNLPFAFSFRVSPLDFLEMVLSLNVTPHFGADTIVGVGGSAKWKIISKTDKLPLGLAAVLSYAWAQEGHITPFAMGTGADISMPVSWSFGDSLAIFLAPALLWAGESGFPNSGIPNLVAASGLSFRQSIFNSGLSVRTEYLFDNGIKLGPLSIAGEIKFFPAPSVFVFSAMAGITYENNSWGGFGGIGIGFIQ